MAARASAHAFDVEIFVGERKVGVRVLVLPHHLPRLVHLLEHDAHAKVDERVAVREARGAPKDERVVPCVARVVGPGCSARAEGVRGFGAGVRVVRDAVARERKADLADGGVVEPVLGAVVEEDRVREGVVRGGGEARAVRGAHPIRRVHRPELVVRGVRPARGGSRIAPAVQNVAAHPGSSATLGRRLFCCGGVIDDVNLVVEVRRDDELVEVRVELDAVEVELRRPTGALGVVPGAPDILVVVGVDPVNLHRGVAVVGFGRVVVLDEVIHCPPLPDRLAFVLAARAVRGAHKAVLHNAVVDAPYFGVVRRLRTVALGVHSEQVALLHGAAPEHDDRDVAVREERERVMRRLHRGQQRALEERVPFPVHLFHAFGERVHVPLVLPIEV
mmetsp:Transcript_15467/g.50867  ORF Transcript_15467/g.50867 Transcript_15467/m.50867 type:complete len:389 (+) Transcript_15467:150-1316(+)